MIRSLAFEQLPDDGRLLARVRRTSSVGFYSIPRVYYSPTCMHDTTYFFRVTAAAQTRGTVAGRLEGAVSAWGPVLRRGSAKQCI